MKLFSVLSNPWFFLWNKSHTFVENTIFFLLLFYKIPIITTSMGIYKILYNYFIQFRQNNLQLNTIKTI